MARQQGTPQRGHWRVEQLVLNVIRRGPMTRRMRPLTGRQKADAFKRIRRACELVKVGIGWTLPPETPAEAKAPSQGNPHIGKAGAAPSGIGGRI